jgi:hypothetical protein
LSAQRIYQDLVEEKGFSSVGDYSRLRTKSPFFTCHQLLLAHQPGHSVFAYAPALLAQRPRHSGAAVALGMGLKDLLDLLR